MTPAIRQRGERALRTGYTTGACAAAAARAGARALVTGAAVERIGITLPNGQPAEFALSRCERERGQVRCGVVKDGGDDPDCTHGAEIVTEVRWAEGTEIRIEGGPGVGVVTRPGLGLPVGGPAVNAVPRRNIVEMVRAEIGPLRGAIVRISVPRGEELARETLNGRLGILGGISILGTTGIVKPYSTSAWRASVVQHVDLVSARGHGAVVLTTGGKSEAFAMRLLPAVPEEAFVQVGDFVGVGIRCAARRGIGAAHVVGMVGKLAKMADGRVQTHAAGAEVNTALLAALAAEAGAGPALQREIAAANTGRHALELCAAAGCSGFATAVCRRVVARLAAHARAPVDVRAWLVGFDGALLGRWPEEEVRT